MGCPSKVIQRLFEILTLVEPIEQWYKCLRIHL